LISDPFKRLSRMPLWLKYVLTLCVFIPLAIGALIYFQDQTGAPPAESAASVVKSNEAARSAVAQDQAVHRAAAPGSLAPAVALERAILADVRTSVAHHVLAGPAQSVTCKAFGTASAGRQAFRCDATVGGLGYPFRGVVDLQARALAWCKDDRFAAAGELNVPLSPACT
jgi:hypothetical protein